MNHEAVYRTTPATQGLLICCCNPAPICMLLLSLFNTLLDTAYQESQECEKLMFFNPECFNVSYEVQLLQSTHYPTGVCSVKKVVGNLQYTVCSMKQCAIYKVK